MLNPFAWPRSRSTSNVRATLLKLIFAFSIVCCFMPLAAQGNPALAYNRNNAANYAEAWAYGRNNNYPSYGADCTNFASQALRAGGYSFVGSPQYWNSGDDSQWWGTWGLGYWFHTNSWSAVRDQYSFQMQHYPGGWLEAVLTTSDSAYFSHWDNVNMIQGDQLYYDWGRGEGMSHMAVQTYGGWSQWMPPGQSWYGDLSAQHVTDRAYVSWNHIEVNGDWPTTTIWEVHIDDRNN
jgi:Putative amidase domain